MNGRGDAKQTGNDIGKARKITDELFARMDKHGFRAKIISVEHLQTLFDDIEGKLRDDLLDQEFYRARLSGFVAGLPDDLPGAKSAIVLAAPEPHTLWTFEWKGQSIPAIIPPSYSTDINNRVKALLDELLLPASFHICRARIPLKLTAVHSGLARYGKNNITYVEGMGSYLRLMAFYTDLPCLEDSWGELQVMEECDKCLACTAKCPTGAIATGRFLIHAEHCLAYYNEREGQFPGNVAPAVHHCLFGCLMCQVYCPINRSVSPPDQMGAAFTAEETAVFLKGFAKDELAPDTLRKLDRFPEFLDCPEEISRNLRALVENPENARKMVRLICGDRQK